MRSRIVIIFSLVIALLLSLLPMPAWTVWMRPAWVLMVLMFWTMMSPGRVNVGVAWLLGLLMDLLTGTMLGEHALAYTVVIYIISRGHLRLVMYPLVQQAACVFLLMLLYQSIMYIIQSAISMAPVSQLYWLSSVITMLLWPWLFLLMRDYSRRFIVL